MEARSLNALEGRKTAGDGDGVAGKRAGLVDGTEGSDLLHDFAATAEGGNGHATADHLAEHREVGLDTVEGLGAALSDAEARHDFVDDEDGAVLRAELAHRAKEFGVAADHVHVAGDGFDDHAGDVVAPLGEGVLKLLRVVVLEHERVLRHGGGNTGRGRIAEGEHAGARLDEERVGVAVVAALELDDLVAARVAAGEADGGHAGLGAGAHEADLVHGRHELADLFGDERLALRDGAEGEALRDGFVNGGDDFVVVVAEDHRAPGEDVVDELLARGVPYVGALGAVDARVAAAGTANEKKRRPSKRAARKTMNFTETV